MRTVDLSVTGMIFRKTGHALHFCFDKTKMELSLFRRCALAEIPPVLLNEVLIELRNLTEREMNGSDPFPLTRLHEKFIENDLRGLEFAHCNGFPKT